MNHYSKVATFNLECYLRDAIRDGRLSQAAELRAELDARNDPTQRERRAEDVRRELTRQHTARLVAEFTREHGGVP